MDYRYIANVEICDLSGLILLVVELDYSVDLSLDVFDRNCAYVYKGHGRITFYAERGEGYF